MKTTRNFKSRKSVIIAKSTDQEESEGMDESFMERKKTGMMSEHFDKKKEEE